MWGGKFLFLTTVKAIVDGKQLTSRSLGPAHIDDSVGGMKTTKSTARCHLLLFNAA